jgi:hypothetical protein
MEEKGWGGGEVIPGGNRFFTYKREWCADEEGVAVGVKIYGW